MRNDLTPEIHFSDTRPEGRDWERFNRQWWITPKGDMCALGCYDIAAHRLKEPSWLLHLSEKRWFDANLFIPAWFEACRRAGITEVTMWTSY